MAGRACDPRIKKDMAAIITFRDHQFPLLQPVPIGLGLRGPGGWQRSIQFHGSLPLKAYWISAKAQRQTPTATLPIRQFDRMNAKRPDRWEARMVAHLSQNSLPLRRQHYRPRGTQQTDAIITTNFLDCDAFGGSSLQIYQLLTRKAVRTK